MSIDVKRYQQLKKEVDRLQRDSDKAEGALDQLMTRLKDEFEVEDIEVAEKLLKKLQGKSKKSEEEFNVSLDQFDEDWDHVLNKGD